MICKYVIDDKRAYLYAIKAFAICSVICGHTAGISPQYGYANLVCSNLLKSFGTIGVSIFFILSGYLFSNTKTDFKTFFKKKMITIFIPWVFTGSLVYLYVAIRKTGIDVKQWCNWLVGNGSYLYFLFMLMVCYLVFWVCKSRVEQAILMMLSICSIFLTSLGFLPNSNPYMNPFNWFLYFGVGFYLQSNHWFEQLIYHAKKRVILWMSAFTLFICFMTYINAYVSYWKWYYLAVEFVAVMLIFGICTYKRVYKNKIIEYIGQVSFSIYLLHMPIAGLVTNVSNRIDSSVLTIGRPAAVLIITVLVIYLYTQIAARSRGGKIFNLLIGIR